ncbi:spore coat protein [Paenibacillus pasadenensis]|uniref:spore coat protein n=1 Tax=Paenibacillus pasadenensis TaxID=217090 RepID=UPI00041587AE|nr:spore coat protein [Paenibacillus pasadenensis]
MNQSPRHDSQHGQHEGCDMQEILAGMVAVLDQFVLFREAALDPELKQLLDRQHRFMLEQYELTLESFSTSRKPRRETQAYLIPNLPQVKFGTSPAAPAKPIAQPSELADKGIAGYALGLLKSQASLLAMTSLELVHPVCRRVVSAQVPEYIEMAYEAFLYLNGRGWYQVPALPAAEAQRIASSFAPAGGSAG